MTVEGWLHAVMADAERRGLPDLIPILETLARATAALNTALERGETEEARGGGVERAEAAIDAALDDLFARLFSGAATIQYTEE